MKEIWTLMRSQLFLDCSALALSNHGSDVRNAFAEFTHWNYFTADRAIPGMFYPEGEYYPRFQPLQEVTFSNSTATAYGNVYALSSSLYAFGLGSDTITAIIANIDVDAAKRRETTTQRVEVVLTSQFLAQPYILLKNGLKGKINVADTSSWRYYFSRESMHLEASPNPFHLSWSQLLLLPVNEDHAKTAEVFFYNSALDLAYSGKLNVINNHNGVRVIEVPASAVKSKLSSGVYFIFAKTQINTYQWKIAVIQ